MFGVFITLSYSLSQGCAKLIQLKFLGEGMEKKGLIIIIVLSFLYWFTRTATYVDSTTEIELRYHIEYTTGTSKSEELPLIIALHGNGDTYSNFYSYTLKDFSIPARIVLIEAPGNYWPYDPIKLSLYSQAIANLAQTLQQEFLTPNKPILLGFSGGAVMSYYSALTECSNYSVIVPISGKLDKQMYPNTITMTNECEVLAFHGKSDSVLSYSNGLRAIKKLREYSKNVKLISFEGGHHGFARDFKSMIFETIRLKLNG